MLMIITGLSGCGRESGSQTVRISAAASLSDVLEEVVETGKTRLQSPVKMNIAGSQMVARQIAEGQPADIVFLANERWMDYLEDQNKIISKSRVNLLSNRIVLIGKTNGPHEIEAADDLRSYSGKIALGNPEGVPAGIYARQTLESMGIWHSIENQVVSFPHVRATLSAVSSGNIPLGIVYETDARRLEDVKIITRLPASHTPEIRYPVALVKGHSEQAKRWFEELKNSGDQYEKYGFHYLPQ